jgi:hypothetical protein
LAVVVVVALSVPVDLLWSDLSTWSRQIDSMDSFSNAARKGRVSVDLFELWEQWDFVLPSCCRGLTWFCDPRFCLDEIIEIKQQVIIRFDGACYCLLFWYLISLDVLCIVSCSDICSRSTWPCTP